MNSDKMGKVMAKVDEGGNSATAETRLVHFGDIRLREHGFKIVARPKDRAAIWAKDGKEYSEVHAHQKCDQENKT